LATEPHRTSASYGLQNYLMNDSDYMRLYTIEGGIERLPQELAARVEARILLREPVVRVERIEDESLRVLSVRHGKMVSEEYDFVVVALPNACVPLIEWGGDALGEAMHRHCAHYDYPAHYLRISVLFREIFWEKQFQDSYMMLDAFGGCCLYDESSRNGCRSAGVLGWLLAGDEAMGVSCLSKGRYTAGSARSTGFRAVRRCWTWKRAIFQSQRGRTCSRLATTCSIRRSTACSTPPTLWQNA
jgi:monoamine oxidase